MSFDATRHDGLATYVGWCMLKSVSLSSVSISCLLSSTLSAFTFKQYIVQPTRKILVITAGILVYSIMTFFIPRVHSFFLLATVYVTKEFFGCYSYTGCAGLMVYTVGPVRSRLMVMAHHFSVGVGFITGPILVARYFSNTAASENNKQHCSGVLDSAAADSVQNKSSETAMATDEIDIVTPFSELAWAQCITTLMFLLLLALPNPMPGCLIVAL